MNPINAIFDTYDIQNANILLTKIEHDNIPTRDLKRYRIIRGDGEIITDSRFGAKRIVMVGRVQGTSRTDLETRLDELRAKLVGASKVSKVLNIDYLGVTRNYTATCVNVAVDRLHGSVNLAEIQIEFISTLPYGLATSSSTLLTSTSQTTTPNSKAITVGGTAENQKLIITVLLNSFTGASINTITLKNNLTNYAISISRAWVAADSLVVDIANMSVKVNGIEVDYSGAFPDFAPEAQTLVYSDDFTARNVNLTVTSTPRYL